MTYGVFSSRAAGSRMLLRRIACLALGTLVLLPGSAAAQGNSRMHRAAVDRVLSDASRLPEKVRVIVQYRPGTRSAVAKRLAGRGGRVLKDHSRIGAVTLELPRAALDHFKRDVDVLGLSSDALVGTDWAQDPATTDSTISATQNTGDDVEGQGLVQAFWTSFGSSFGFDAQALRSTLGITTFDTGSTAGIAIIDSGIAPVADLSGRITAFYDFTQGGIATAPTDPYGHGTHIAGLIAGNGLASAGKYVGVAKSVRLIGLRVLNAQGQGYSSDVIAALDFAIANKASLGIDVINLSLGHPIYESVVTDPLVRAVERAVAAGMVVVVSAGNHGMDANGNVGYAGITSPGNAPSALTVGSLRTKATATRLDDEVSPFSSRGPTWYDGFSKPDVLAPGQALVAIGTTASALYQNAALRADVGLYLKLSGTSMAAGVASGVAALVIDANRKDEGVGSVLTPNVVKAILQYTAIPVTDPDTSTPAMLEQGTGGLNAAGAIALAKAIDPSMPVGASWIEYGVLPVSPIAGTPMTWSQHLVWGDHIVWGDTVTWNLEAWAYHVIWGEDDEHIVWGDEDEHIVWGDSFLQGSSGVFDSFLAWSTHVVWGEAGHVVWSENDDEHIVWGDSTGGGSEN